MLTSSQEVCKYKYLWKEVFSMAKPSHFGRDVLSVEEVDNIIHKMPTLDMQSLSAFLYISGCRIHEALRLVKNSHNVNLTQHYVYIRLKTLKRGGAITYRTLPIKYDVPFFDIVISHLGRVADGEKVWNFSYWTFRRRLREINPTAWCHLFRHTRATEFTMKGKNEHQLQRWFGWSDTRPAKQYVHQSDKMIKDMYD